MRRGRRAPGPRRRARRARAAGHGRQPRVPCRVPRGDADRSSACTGQPAVRSRRLHVLRRGQRRAVGDRRCDLCGKGACAKAVGRRRARAVGRAPAGRHATRRRGVLAVQLGFDRSSEGRRPPAPRPPGHLRDVRTARPRHHRSGRHVLDDEAFPRVRPRQQPLIPLLGRRDDRALGRSSDTGRDLRGGRAVPPNAVLLGADALQRHARGRARR